MFFLQKQNKRKREEEEEEDSHKVDHQIPQHLGLRIY